MSHRLLIGLDVFEIVDRALLLSALLLVMTAIVAAFPVYRRFRPASGRRAAARAGITGCGTTATPMPG